MDYKKLEQEFNSLEESEQWFWAINRRKQLSLRLDNDSTGFRFIGEEDTEDCTLFYFKADIGNRSGVEIILKCIGFDAESV